jgi:NAD(P)-dependent dehydrogenase (short-subunit alcohol dehydrogenase family)
MAAYQSVFRAKLFEGQAGIVTGAGSGIGRCTAHELAALGARVALIGRKADKLEAVAREIADAGGTARLTRSSGARNTNIPIADTMSRGNWLRHAWRSGLRVCERIAL